ncbi:hypothetical protein PPTG_21173 [Phytophthora nicotianae INRA-310]|uniref:PiggyBac transposable element-derived protein domain-containing protein n=1 Tax=Phytophthora nicotianae (strain INRA-310) TaxID=761204 RepID=W2RBP2_PHYN3|nr:hypothetical protein PPTG_21173 [Phytophthora nicotianae INRA-310]ETN21965.1 hypothetical protein PPTG_21173 [Phytophthora nicotianae INRA-310]
MPPSVTPKPQRPMPDAPTPPLVEPAGLTPPLNDSAIPPAPSMAPPVPVRRPTRAEAKTSKRKQRRAAKATPQDVLQPLNQPSVRASASAASSIGRPAATAKRSSATSRSSTKKRRAAQVIPDSTVGVPGMTDQHIPDQAATTEETEDAVPDGPDSVTGNTERAVTEARNTLVSARSVLDHDRGNGVSLDDFDSDNFLEALRRDRLFEGSDPDDLNVGVDDWLLALDSDVEGDEESIFLDEDNSEDEDESEADVSGAVSDDESVEDFAGVDDDVPVEFDLAEADLKRLQAEEWDALMEDDSGRLQLDPAPLYDGPYGPTRTAMAYATSPLAMFYFFLPKELWRKIAEETNRYQLESIHEIAEGMRERAVQKRQTVPSTIVYTVDEYEAKLRRKYPIQPHEIVRFIGLLIARTLEPRRESLSRHWITKVEGALSRCTFGQFISRDRFHDIAKYLHFNDNAGQPESADRTFKIRPVLQAIQKTFFRGYRLGARISFDEGMVSMWHRRNPMRQYMSAKPNKLDIYCGKANKDEDAVAQRAVVQNLTHVLRGQPAQRLICTDNFILPFHYRTSCCIEFTQKRRPKRMARGTYKIASWRGHPEFVALFWMDNKPVRFLATGCSTQLTDVSRREPDGSISRVPYPQLVRDYHEAMGGVDVHDQLRLQRYSIQRSIRMRKYYKTIFLGLVDIALVNAFIVHKLAMKKKRLPVPTHAAFMLHVDLLNQTSVDLMGGDELAALLAEPLPARAHTLEHTGELNGSKRRQWLCKVCSAYAGTGERSFEASYFCATCSAAKREESRCATRPADCNMEALLPATKSGISSG